MRWRIGTLAAAGTVIALTAAPPPTPAAVAAVRKWCMTYCDVIHVGCKKTIGWLDQEACEEWHKGCLDGCRVAE
jgi:hypothetical protein